MGGVRKQPAAERSPERIEDVLARVLVKLEALHDIPALDDAAGRRAKSSLTRAWAQLVQR